MIDSPLVEFFEIIQDTLFENAPVILEGHVFITQVNGLGLLEFPGQQEGVGNVNV